MWVSNVLLLCSIAHRTLCSTLNPSPELSSEDPIMSLTQRMNAMEERLLALEKLQEQTLEEREELSRRLLALQILSEGERSKLESVYIKENLTRTLLNSHIASQREINENLLKFQNMQTNFTKKISNLENSLLNFGENSANASSVSKLYESVENLDRTTNVKLQSIQDDIYPRLKLLEERSNLHNDVTEIKKVQTDHSSEINALNKELSHIEKLCDDEPPSLKNGKSLDFERKHGSNVQYECDRNFVMTGRSTVRCNFGEWEGHPPVCTYYDNTFYLETTQGYFTNITCYSDENSEKIEFSRTIDWGGRPILDGSLPPNTTKSTSKRSATIDFTDVEDDGSYHMTYNGGVAYDDRFGVIQCRFSEKDRNTNIVLSLQRNVELSFPERYKVANVGDTIQLQVNHTRTREAIRWKHNGVIIPSWDNKSVVEIRNAQPSDTGIYECYYVEYPNSYNRALLSLVLRKCRENLYGEHCDQKCPSCYNGGMCHDLLGICICPSGFTGDNCETACPAGFHGVDCSRKCENGDCKFRFFCKPDPYGCACTRGFKGMFCQTDCEPGWYGVDCKQPCHCINGPDSCDRFTGACSGGCVSSWTGESCQIEDVR